MKKVLLFHSDVFMPDGVQELCRKVQSLRVRTVYSKHLKSHMEDSNKDRSHRYFKEAVEKCIESLKDSQQDCFEVELTLDQSQFSDCKWHVTKFCCRVAYDSNQDICLAIRPLFDERDGNLFIVAKLAVTAWMNHKDDSHSTLDASKYCTKENWMKEAS